MLSDYDNGRVSSLTNHIITIMDHIKIQTFQIMITVGHPL
jgi:hypothetical protein